eukprot:jgi/Psemu1/5841/gm1.5841_g
MEEHEETPVSFQLETTLLAIPPPGQVRIEQGMELDTIKLPIKLKAEKTKNQMTTYSKKNRKNLKETARMDLLNRIKMKQQQPFHAITVSKNDPEKLTNTHSIGKLVDKNKRNLQKYDPLTVYTIFIPEDEAFNKNPNNPDYSKLKLDTNSQPITYDLFTNSPQLTAKQKNVDAYLYVTVHAYWMEFKPSGQGGLLFLKLVLLDKVNTTGKTMLNSFRHLLKTYQIKRNSKGEDIVPHVAEIVFKAIFNSIKELQADKDLLEDSVTSNLLKVFGITRVEDFNNQFASLESKRELASVGFNGGQVMLNDMETVKFILGYANAFYKDMVKKGKWDDLHPGTHSRAPLGERNFNYVSKEHQVCECPEKKDQERISINKDLRPNGMQGHCIPYKWRALGPNKHKKGVIDGIPHTWDPTSGSSGRWTTDNMHSDKQVRNGSIPTILSQPVIANLGKIAQCTNSTQFIIGASTITGTTSFTLNQTTYLAEQRLQLYMFMQKCKLKFDEL